MADNVKGLFDGIFGGNLAFCCFLILVLLVLCCGAF
jgi:hypothetical protein